MSKTLTLLLSIYTTSLIDSLSSINGSKKFTVFDFLPMKSTLAFTLPIFNLNGTSPESVYDEFNEALESLHKAHDALHKCTVHGRDFQCNPIGHYDRARDEYRVMLNHLEEAIYFCESWMERAQEAINR